jgi:hypothetical protein
MPGDGQNVQDPTVRKDGTSTGKIEGMTTTEPLEWTGRLVGASQKKELESPMSGRGTTQCQAGGIGKELVNQGEGAPAPNYKTRFSAAA